MMNLTAQVVSGARTSYAHHVGKSLHDSTPEKVEKSSGSLQPTVAA